MSTTAIFDRSAWSFQGKKRQISRQSSSKPRNKDNETYLGQIWMDYMSGWVGYLCSFIMPLITLGAAAMTGRNTTPSWAIASSILTIVYAFIAIPLLDTILGSDYTNTKKEDVESAHTYGRYRRLLQLYVPATYAMLAGVCHLLCIHRDTMSLAAYIGSIVSLGVANSMAFTVAHELLHSSDPFERLLSSVLLIPNFYMHWTRSHLQHHCWIGTPKDPATARKGETVYYFWCRSIYGNLVGGYGAEMKRKKYGKIATWIAAPLALLLATHTLYGSTGVTIHLGQALVAILMLETVNYIEHYGLERKQGPDGRYERTMPKHSWNATTIFTNAVSFKLQRHSDHHARETVPYFLLQHVQDAPQLPHGYPAMMLASLIPPLFFRIMNPRIPV